MFEERTILVGAGNVAQGLYESLCKHTKLIAWANRTSDKLRAIIGGKSCPAITTPDEIYRFKADIIIIAVSDSAIDSIIDSITSHGTLDDKPLCLLTSGTVDKEKLLTLSPRVGILYPLQTFTDGFPVDIAEIPFFTEATDTSDLQIIDNLVLSLGAMPYHANEEQRHTLHIAGVFANNFVNILLEETQKALSACGYTLEMVKPLVEMTVRKAFVLGPHAAQTGPARRGDTEVMLRQYQHLPERLRPAFAELNKLICTSHNTDYKL